MTVKTRVVIADDSPTMRATLHAFLKDEPEIEVVGQAVDGAEAVEMARELRPDVITMDVMMPRLDGLAAVERIMAEAPTRILIVSALAKTQQELSFRALAAGALEVIAKPSESEAQAPRAWVKELARSIVLMREVPVVSRRRATTPGPSGFFAPGTVDAFGFAASTGGPQTLSVILSRLPAELPIPLLVAQHIAPGFITGFLGWLGEICGLKLAIAADGDALLPGHVYFPPGGCHLEVDKAGLLRTTSGTGGGHCPSGDRLLTSLARAFGNRAGGAVLTGMGDDGARGLLAIRDAGGLTMAQSEASCVGYGKPEAAALMGATKTAVTPESIAQIICETARIRRASGER